MNEKLIAGFIRNHWDSFCITVAKWRKQMQYIFHIFVFALWILANDNVHWSFNQSKTSQFTYLWIFGFLSINLSTYSYAIICVIIVEYILFITCCYITSYTSNKFWRVLSFIWMVHTSELYSSTYNIGNDDYHSCLC